MGDTKKNLHSAVLVASPSTVVTTAIVAANEEALAAEFIAGVGLGLAPDASGQAFSTPGAEAARATTQGLLSVII